MKKNGMHLYQHVQNHILERIAKKDLRSGDRVPGEQELSRSMNVSRLTVRKAYSALIEAGILTALQGKGTFVNDLAGVSPKDLSLDSRKGFLSKKVIGVAMATARLRAVKGAMRGRLINGLITNETMAELLLET